MILRITKEHFDTFMITVFEYVVRPANLSSGLYIVPLAVVASVK